MTDSSDQALMLSLQNTINEIQKESNRLSQMALNSGSDWRNRVKEETDQQQNLMREINQLEQEFTARSKRIQNAERQVILWQTQLLSVQNDLIQCQEAAKAAKAASYINNPNIGLQRRYEQLLQFLRQNEQLLKVFKSQQTETRNQISLLYEDLNEAPDVINSALINQNLNDSSIESYTNILDKLAKDIGLNEKLLNKIALLYGINTSNPNLNLRNEILLQQNIMSSSAAMCKNKQIGNESKIGKFLFSIPMPFFKQLTLQDGVYCFDVVKLFLSNQQLDMKDDLKLSITSQWKKETYDQLIKIADIIEDDEFRRKIEKAKSILN